MQTSARNRDAGASFAARAKRHAPLLSISDDSHHVTETIGFLYGDEDDRDPHKTSKPSLNTRTSPSSAHSLNTMDQTNPSRNNSPRKFVPETSRSSASRSDSQGSAQQIPHPSRAYSFDKTNGQSQSSIALASRDQSPSDTAQAHFPLNNIDYESSPAAVAQELSNLQALRRMSMDVHAAGDPDLPSLNPAALPNAPSSSASEDDAARLFWVPARLHPELAPKEFKTFLESKAEQIKRRSGDLSSFTSSPMASRSGSSSSLGSDDGSLMRKKSMLSREVNNSSGYQDGADILDRKRSMSTTQSLSDPNLAELEHLVSSNLHLQRPDSSDGDVDFILPSVPASSLKRSTKTRYQKPGGPVKARGDRLQRGIRRVPTMEQEINVDNQSPSVPDMPSQYASLVNFDSGDFVDTLNFGASKSSGGAQNFSRPAAQSSSLPCENVKTLIASNTFDTILGPTEMVDRNGAGSTPDPHAKRKHIIKSERANVPQIVATPPSEDVRNQRTAPSNQRHPESKPQPPLPQQRHPERTSSRDAAKTVASRPPMSRKDSSINAIPTSSSITLVPSTNSPKQSLEQPSPLPGNDTNTNNLTLIPTLTVDKASQERKESKKSGWGWLLGKDDDKEKGKNRSGRHAQSHDNTRLDLLQTSIDSSWKRRETIELDRDSLKLEDERKKESQRKGSVGERREKESIFSSLFGGKKHKAEKESRKSPRLSPEPRHRELKPDIDYSWTRFTLLEERAIYRMAHIKLANPRRPLHSQVLLSNFMYSYLAKVQQMHPQMNLPSSAKQQKKQQKEQQQKQQQQSEEFNTYQRYQQQQAQQQQAAESSSQQQQPMTYEGQYSSNEYEQDNSRSNTRSSSQSANQHNNDYSHNSYSNRQQQQQSQQYETDRESSDMW